MPGMSLLTHAFNNSPLTLNPEEMKLYANTFAKLFFNAELKQSLARVAQSCKYAYMSDKSIISKE